ncbi:MAG TPA: hypothetical protein VHC90_13835, partial [Bryobacteraceae bacterium]|nr:hypothetical protein [Bryobacteraceae bacterium]
YDVKWNLWDDLGRVCRSASMITAHLGPRAKSVKVAIPPGTAADFSWQPPSRENAVAKTRLVTILLNAAIPAANHGQRAENEWPALLTILSSLLENLPEANVRLVLFNLDQQQELFQNDEFTAKDVAGIAHATDVLARWKVDANVLRSPLGGWDLIRKLEDTGIHASAAPDTIVFLGLPAANDQKAPDDMPKSGLAKRSRFFYLRYLPPDAPPPRRAPRGPGPTLGGGGGRGMGGMIPMANPRFGYPQPDPIEQAVRRMGGKTIVISSPESLADAISSVKKQR